MRNQRKLQLTSLTNASRRHVDLYGHWSLLKKTCIGHKPIDIIVVVIIIIIFIYHTRTEHKMQKLNSAKKYELATREATAH